jgi:predicted DNA-binding transcriptional regulator YafY
MRPSQVTERGSSTGFGASSDQIVTVRYRNYRGETSLRRVLPRGVWYGSTDWHPEPQWVMDVLDVDRDVERSFALRDILDFDCK